MDEYKCPRCNKKLSEEELKDKICLECGCLFSVNPNKKKTKAYSNIIKDTRKMNYRFWIKFYIFFLILWSILTVYGIIQGFISLQAPWSIVILISSIVLYALVFTIIQFHINLIRDVYILKKKLEQKEKK